MGGPQARQPQRSSRGRRQRWRPAVANSWLPFASPWTDIQALLQAILDDHVFSLTQVDIHTPEGLKTCSGTYHPSSSPSRCPRTTLDHIWSNSVWMLIPTLLVCWYLLNGLVVTRFYLLMQYDRLQCFQSLARACAQKQGDTQQDSSQALAGESAKLLMTSVYGKCCENKTRFLQTYFVKGPVASKACSFKTE